MYSKEEIFNKIKNILINTFEIDVNKITPNCNLYDELDLDSIDAIDLINYIKKETNIKLTAEDFQKTTTISDVVDVIYDKINEK